jgi:hypothetical protein
VLPIEKGFGRLQRKSECGILRLLKGERAKNLPVKKEKKFVRRSQPIPVPKANPFVNNPFVVHGKERI